MVDFNTCLECPECNVSWDEEIFLKINQPLTKEHLQEAKDWDKECFLFLQKKRRGKKMTTIHEDCGGKVYTDVTCYDTVFRCEKCKSFSIGFPEKTEFVKLPNKCLAKVEK